MGKKEVFYSGWRRQEPFKDPVKSHSIVNSSIKKGCCSIAAPNLNRWSKMVKDGHGWAKLGIIGPGWAKLGKTEQN
jgi:hypothetical protein